MYFDALFAYYVYSRRKTNTKMKVQKKVSDVVYIYNIMYV